MLEDGPIARLTYEPQHRGVVLGIHGATQFFHQMLVISSETIETVVHSKAFECCADTGDHCAGGYMSLDDEDVIPFADNGVVPAGGYGSPKDNLQALIEERSQSPSDNQK